MAVEKEEHHDTYIIPPNFVESGTILGGMFKLRNAIEAGALALLIGFPIFKLSLPLMTRIIILCMTALPAALLALVGINGESLSSFVVNFFKFLLNRRVVGQVQKQSAQAEPQIDRRIFRRKNELLSQEPKSERREPKSEVAALKQQLREARLAQRSKSATREEPANPQRPSIVDLRKKRRRDMTVADYLPIDKIANGVIYTRDHRYVKIIEVALINFLFRSAREQRNIIYSFISFPKISPVKMQFKVLTKRADVNRQIEHIRQDIENEPEEISCKRWMSNPLLKQQGGYPIHSRMKRQAKGDDNII